MSSEPGALPERFPSSPQWNKNTKLFVTACVTVFLVTVLITFRQIFQYVLLALVLSMVIRPIVDFIDERFGRIPRWLNTLVIYLMLLGGLIAIPVSTLPSLVRQVASFIAGFPTLLEQSVSGVGAFLSQPIEILGGRYTIPVDQIRVEELQQYLGQAVSFVAGSLSSVNALVLNITTVTLTVISSIILCLFLAYYLTKDGHLLADKIVYSMPDGYQEDADHLMNRINLIWGAFLRGQLILMLTIGVLTFIVASILGLPNPVALGVIAGLMEIIPYAGPLLAAVPAVLLAWFQPEASWAGMLVGPFWFTMITAFAYWLIQQIENYLLVPRILGHQLKLHPALVFIAALAGWQLAGIFGIFLASPMLATLRLLGTFIFGKLTDQTISDLTPDEVISAEITPSPEPVKPINTDSLQPAVLRSNVAENGNSAETISPPLSSLD